MEFIPGWWPSYATAARDRTNARGGYYTLRPTAAPIPPAMSLSQYRLRHLEQLHAGTCWVHSAVQNVEVSAMAAGLAAFPICRMLVGYAGKALEGGGNPTNGGAPTDALLAMTADKGAGIAHEALWPYSDNSRALAQSPSAAVLADAKAAHLIAPVDVASDDDARRLIASGRPVSNGIFWVYALDDPQTFHYRMGPGTFGHALLEIGYAQPGVFDDHAWIQLDNWHGLLYPPLTPDKAAKVPGYRSITPTATSDFWIRTDLYATIRAQGNAERVAATDLAGIAELFTLADVLASPLG